MTKFIHISDPHLSADYTGRDIMRLIEKTGLTLTEQYAIGMKKIKERHPDIDFYIITGDIVQDGSKEEYERFREYIQEETGGKPCYITTGNHDSDAIWQGWFGEERNAPYDYSFMEEKSGLKVIALDTRGGPYGSGVLSAEQLSWLKEQLSDGEATIILMHHTPHIGDDEYLIYQMQTSKEFHDVVCGSDIRGIFTGHTHIRFESKLGEIPCHTAPSITFGLIVEGHTMTATDMTGYNYCTYSDGIITVENVDIPGTGAQAGII